MSGRFSAPGWCRRETASSRPRARGRRPDAAAASRCASSRARRRRPTSGRRCGSPGASCAHVKSNAVIFTGPRRDAGGRRRPDEPRRCGQGGRDEGRRSARADRSRRPMRSSRSAMASTRSPPPARRPSSSPAARSATPKSSPPPTNTASRWCSPAGGIFDIRGTGLFSTVSDRIRGQASRAGARPVPESV